MKLTLNQIEQGEEEVMINYLEMNERIKDIVRSVHGKEERILGWKADTECFVPVRDILYVESVDRGIFAYTMKEVYRISQVLSKMESEYENIGFFRCSKAMVININMIEALRSEAGNRIDAKLQNGEHVMISRRYAKALRCVLRGEKNE